MEKRKFYNTGDAKGFTKADFFKAVAAMAKGEEVDEATIDLVAQAADYEIEGMELKAAKAASGEKKDALQSDYANLIRKNIIPFLTNEPKSAKELSQEAFAKKVKGPSGSAYSAPWISRVFNAEAEAGNGIVKVKKIIEKVNSKGLKAQAEVVAYKRG